MNKLFTPSGVSRKSTNDGSNSKNTTNKRISFFDTPNDIQELERRERKQAEQLQDLKEQLERRTTQLDYLRRAIRQRKIESELRRQIEQLQRTNGQLMQNEEKLADLIEKYKVAAKAATKKLEMLQQQNVSVSHVNGKMRFLLSYVVEKLQDLFDKWQSFALQHRDSSNEAWQSFKKSMLQCQFNICTHTRKTMSQILGEDGSSACQTDNRIMARLLVRNLI